jgi:predicted nucleic acid-binding protein
MSLMRVLFDMNVLIYARDSASIYHTEAADLLTKAFDF